MGPPASSFSTMDLSPPCLQELSSSLFFMMLYVVLSLISKSSVVSATSQSTNSLPYQGLPLDDPDLLLFPALQPNKHPWLPSETLCNASSFPSTVSRVRVLPHAWNTCLSCHVCHIPEWDSVSFILYFSCSPAFNAPRHHTTQYCETNSTDETLAHVDLNSRDWYSKTYVSHWSVFICILYCCGV